MNVIAQLSQIADNQLIQKTPDHVQFIIAAITREMKDLQDSIIVSKQEIKNYNDFRQCLGLSSTDESEWEKCTWEQSNYSMFNEIQNTGLVNQYQFRKVLVRWIKQYLPKTDIFLLNRVITKLFDYLKDSSECCHVNTIMALLCLDWGYNCGNDCNGSFEKSLF